MHAARIPGRGAAQVVGQRRAQAGHRALPGQGRASAARGRGRPWRRSPSRLPCAAGAPGRPRARPRRPRASGSPRYDEDGARRRGRSPPGRRRLDDAGHRLGSTARAAARSSAGTRSWPSASGRPDGGSRRSPRRHRPATGAPPPAVPSRRTTPRPFASRCPPAPSRRPRPREARDETGQPRSRIPPPPRAHRSQLASTISSPADTPLGSGPTRRPATDGTAPSSGERDDALQIAEPQEPPQGGNKMPGAWPPRGGRTAAQQETRDVPGPHAYCQFDRSAALQAQAAKKARQPHVALHGPRREPPLGLQVVPVALQDRPAGSLGHNGSLSWCSRSLKMRM